MTILQSLAGYYDRMAARGEVPRDGFTSQAVDFKLVINDEGRVVSVADLRERVGKRLVRKQLAVPHPQRTSNVMPNFLWDKTSYLFGVTAGQDKRTAEEHAAFRAVNILRLKNASDPALVAFSRFLHTWRSIDFVAPDFSEEMKDKNFVVALDGSMQYIHDTAEAAVLVAGVEARTLPSQMCLITGAQLPVAELHPVTKNVRGSQSSGAYLVSFNAPAFTSWNAVNGANAPVSTQAVAQYSTALNELLRSADNKLQIGDATVAFWADTSASGEAAAQKTEHLLAGWFAVAAKVDIDRDAAEAERIRQALEPIAAGRPHSIDGVEVLPATSIHILGLSPNAARLSVRFWLTETLGHLAANLRAHAADCRIEPLPWRSPPSVNRLLVNTVAAQEKWDNIPPLLAGEVARAVLAGTAYPRTWLANAVMRLRAGDDPATGWHAAAIRAVLMRSGGGAPVGLDKTEPNPAYRLGRLFAVLEAAQHNALGRVNATIRDRYFGAASATPASVFPLLMRGGQNHLAVLRKEGKGGGLERDLEEIVGGLATELPRSLRLEDQGRFAIGYYHQRAVRFAKADAAPTAGGDA